VSERDPRLERWLAELVGTPGLTAINDPGEAWRVLVEESLAAVGVVRELAGPIVDVGSGGGVPGIPLAAALPDRSVTLLEANGRKTEFLEQSTTEFPNISVVRGRAEEQAPDRFGAAVARALAEPPVAVEWCLPLVEPGGAAVLYVGPTVDARRVAAVAARIGGQLADSPPGLLVVRKVAPTPPGFPRRTGVARKRPLA
jgi:16S rRNA (guanine527-N7)-methyltransferase